MRVGSHAWQGKAFNILMNTSFYNKAIIPQGFGSITVVHNIRIVSLPFVLMILRQFSLCKSAKYDLDISPILTSLIAIISNNVYILPSTRNVNNQTKVKIKR